MKKKTNPKKNETENPKSDSHLKDPNWKWSHLDWSDWEDGTLDSEGESIVFFNRPRKPKKED